MFEERSILSSDGVELAVCLGGTCGCDRGLGRIGTGRNKAGHEGENWGEPGIIHAGKLSMRRATLFIGIDEAESRRFPLQQTDRHEVLAAGGRGKAGGSFLRFV